VGEGSILRVERGIYLGCAHLRIRSEPTNDPSSSRLRLATTQLRQEEGERGDHG
jgi:hypothetical protein